MHKIILFLRVYPTQVLKPDFIVDVKMVEAPGIAGAVTEIFIQVEHKLHNYKLKYVMLIAQKHLTLVNKQNKPNEKIMKDYREIWWL